MRTRRSDRRRGSRRARRCVRSTPSRCRRESRSVADERAEPTAEDFAEQIKQIDIAELLLSTVSTLGQLAYVKLGANERDQARLAIDGLAALLPTLEGHADEQLLRDLKQLLANVRLAFVSGGTAAEQASPPESEPESAPAPEPQLDAEPESEAEPAATPAEAPA